MDRSSCIFKSKFSLCASMLIALGAASGCQPRGTNLARMYAAAPPPMATVDFAALKANVLVPHCIACHADFATEAGLLNYVLPGDAGNSMLYKTSADGSMPPGGPRLQPSSLSMIKVYIDQFRGGSVPPTPPPVVAPPAPGGGDHPPVVADYATIKARILAPRCLGCHADFGTEAGLAPYITPGDPDKSSLVQSIAGGTMPPSGPAVPAEDLKLLRAYVAGLKPAAAESAEP